MDRRDTVFALLALGAAPLAAEAQQAAKVARIGYLSPSLASSPHLRDAFLQGLRDLGYVEGRNVVIEYRDAEGKRLRTFATGTAWKPRAASCSAGSTISVRASSR